jgi:hypothetical protein
MTTASLSASPAVATVTAATAVAAHPRFDMYTGIHKALRAFMADTLLRLGTLDHADDDERQQVLDQVDALLSQLRAHLDHENTFVHAAIEARCPGGAAHTAGDHVAHEDAIASLEDASRALRDARPAQRDAMGLALYRHLSAFVAENLEHMLIEERDNQALLWKLYSDAELIAIHDALVASIDPGEMMRLMRWFAVALSAAELAPMFADMRAKAPAPAFEAMIDVVRSRMPEARWAKLARALGLAPVPGLVEA